MDKPKKREAQQAASMVRVGAFGGGTGGRRVPRRGVAGVALQPSTSCFGLPGRGVLSNASIHGRLGRAHKTMRHMVLSPQRGVADGQTEGDVDAP
jgi:hypothetical protein